LVTAIVMLVIAAGAFLRFAKPAYHWYRGRQATESAVQAREHIEREEWKQAFKILAEAYRLAPQQPEVLRVMAELYAFADLKKQRQMLVSLYQTGKYLEQDLRDLIDLDIKFRDLKRASRITDVLLSSFPHSVENLETAIAVEQARGDSLAEETLLEEILRTSPGDRDTRFQLARLRLSSSFEEKVRSGWDEIYALGQQQDEAGLKALRLTVRREPFYPTRTRNVRDLVGAHPLATERDQVAALGWYYQLAVSPDEKERLLAEAVVARSGVPVSEMRDFCFWLNSIQEHQRVIELLSGDEVFATPELLTVYMTALIQGERFDRIREILDKDDGLDPSSEVAFIKAQCAVHLKMDTGTIRGFLDEAYELALIDKRSEMLPHVAGFAERQGLLDLAQSIYKSMTRFPQTQIAGYERLLNLAKRHRDTSAMRGIAGEIDRRIPGNPVVLKMIAYLDLLRGSGIETTLARCRKFADSNSDDREWQLFLAFGLFRMGNFEAANDILDGLTPAGFSSSHRAAYAAIAGAGGDPIAAVTIAEKLEVSLLLEEEVELLRPYLPVF
ncbi:MAG: tetratricopeptide repeat protein, partial [Verrucomicrobiales bacterium]